jgi:hypothetical protein
MSDLTIREIVSDAIGFWERARIVYNAALAIVLLAVFLTMLPQSKEALSFDNATKIFMAAVFANVLYCAGYVPDVCAQLSVYRAKWLRMRWGLFAVGMIFAANWTRFVSISMFGGK